MAADGSDSDSPDLEALQLTREESRAVLDHQLTHLRDVDDKAMRTVRTAVILLSLLISVVGLAGPERIASLDILVKAIAAVGGAGLGATAITGIGVYVTSNKTFGIGTTHRAEVRNASYTEREWLNVLLDEYDDWTDTMRSVNERNVLYLFITQFLLAVSMGLLFVATVLLLITV